MKTTGRKNPALIELVLVILFFALSSMVLVQVFVKAKTISQTSQAKTLGLLLAQDIIEQWRADPAQPEALFLAERGWVEKEAAGSLVFSVGCDETLDLISGQEEREENGNGETEKDRIEKEEAGKEAVREKYRLRAVLLEEEQPGGRLYRIEVTLTERATGTVLVTCQTAHYLPEEKQDE